MMDIAITTDFIKLDSLLKLADICSSGGEAKMLIKSEQVTLNGKICTERGKKVYQNDIVCAHGKTVKVVK